MRIGITTFHWSNNYGAILQTYALQSLLHNYGHDVQILDYRPPNAVPYVPIIRRLLGKDPRTSMRKWIAFLRHIRFERFRKERLRLSPRRLVDLDGLNTSAVGMDMLITGSDQVWNPVFLDYQSSFDAYFLNFGSEKTQRISYAASVGHSSVVTISPWAEIMTEKLSRLDAISVREDSGGVVISELTGRKDVVTVADPTLLLEAGDYRSALYRQTKISDGIFSYILHCEDLQADPVIKQVEHDLDLPVYRCNLTETELKHGYVRPTPETWIQHIDQASFVVTNSYHGVIFCLLMHTPFLVLPVSGKKATMNNRVTELLAKTGLHNRMVALDCPAISDVVNTVICWTSVDEKLAEFRASGQQFLNHHCRAIL